MSTLRRAHDFFLAPQPQHALVGARILLGLTLAGSKVPTGAEGEILIPPE